MKKTIIIAATLLLAISARAQGSLREIISVIRGIGTVQCDYSYTAKGDIPVTGKGVAVISGDKYHLSDGSIDTWCDGVSTWTVDRAGKEVVITGGGNPLITNLEDYESIIHIYSFDGKSLVCSIVSEVQGLNVDFKAENISPVSDAADQAFSFDVSALGSEWIITDLR